MGDDFLRVKRSQILTAARRKDTDIMDQRGTDQRHRFISRHLQFSGYRAGNNGNPLMMIHELRRDRIDRLCKAFRDFNGE